MMPYLHSRKRESHSLEHNYTNQSSYYGDAIAGKASMFCGNEKGFFFPFNLPCSPTYIGYILVIMDQFEVTVDLPRVLNVGVGFDAC
jgi:hypothetical protein